MLQQIENSTHSLESNFYIYEITPYVGAWLLWVPLVPETNVYFNQMCHIYFI